MGAEQQALRTAAATGRSEARAADSDKQLEGKQQAFGTTRIPAVFLLRSGSSLGPSRDAQVAEDGEYLGVEQQPPQTPNPSTPPGTPPPHHASAALHPPAPAGPCSCIVFRLRKWVLV